MAFYVDKQKTLRNILEDLLEAKFGDKVSLKQDGHKLHVTFAKDVGVPDKHFRLTQEEIDACVCGGGFVEGVDGQTFCISIELEKSHEC